MRRMKELLWLALALSGWGWGQGYNLGGNDPWALIDEATQPRPWIEALACSSENPDTLLRLCLQDNTKGLLNGALSCTPAGCQTPNYRGEPYTFQSDGPDGLHIIAYFPQPQGVQEFLRSMREGNFMVSLFFYSFLLSEISWMLETALSGGISGGIPSPIRFSLFVPPNAITSSEMQSSLCSQAKELEGRIKTLEQYISSLYKPAPRVEVRTSLGSTNQAQHATLAVRVYQRLHGGYRAGLMAFGKKEGSRWFWKGVYGEPFTRKLLEPYRTLLFAGSKILCSY